MNRNTYIVRIIYFRIHCFNKLPRNKFLEYDLFIILYR